MCFYVFYFYEPHLFLLGLPASSFFCLERGRGERRGKEERRERRVKRERRERRERRARCVHMHVR